MSWIEVRAEVEPSHDHSALIEVFRAHGIENTLEETSALVGAIVDVQGSDAKVQELSDALMAAGAISVSRQVLPEVDWDEVWRVHFKPRRIGRRFVIRPTWEAFEANPDDIVIVLDPGQAFGTGDHATTRLCLELLEDMDLAGKDVADVGCGSGVLSIAAVKLGARVQAVDIESVAVEVTRENAAFNNVEFRSVVGAGIRALVEPAAEVAGHWEQDEHPLTAAVSAELGEEIAPAFDVVVSNIISAILIRISADVASALRPGGEWVVSGIIPQNWPDVLEAAERVGFVLSVHREEDGWVAGRFRLA